MVKSKKKIAFNPPCEDQRRCNILKKVKDHIIYYKIKLCKLMFFFDFFEKKRASMLHFQNIEAIFVLLSLEVSVWHFQKKVKS